nr:MAG TPA: hypothetical protein [Caudoviricetes sp.]
MKKTYYPQKHDWLLLLRNTYKFSELKKTTLKRPHN